jgi:hypothetical protein
MTVSRSKRKAPTMTVGKLIEALEKMPRKWRVRFRDSSSGKISTTLSLEPYVGSCLGHRTVILHPSGLRAMTPWRLLLATGGDCAAGPIVVVPADESGAFGSVPDVAVGNAPQETNSVTGGDDENIF